LDKKFFVIVDNNVVCNNIAKNNKNFYTKAKEEITITNFLFEEIIFNRVLIKAIFFYNINNCSSRVIEL